MKRNFNESTSEKDISNFNFSIIQGDSQRIWLISQNKNKNY